MFTKDQLRKYSDIMINFALGRGKGIKSGEVIYLQVDKPALPLAYEVYERIIENGAHPIVQIYDQKMSKIFYDKASDSQLEFFPEKYMKGMVDEIDHRIYLIADEDPLMLKEVPAGKLMKSRKSKMQLRKWMNKKEDEGNLTWTLCMYPTEKQAAEANLSLKEFTNQMVKACFLDKENPVEQWKSIINQIEEIMSKLNSMKIEKLHVEAKETDLWITMGEKRKWIGGRGANIPSFEIFTSPDWRGTEGKIYFDQPLYRYGNLIKDVRLEFKEGKVIKATASQNEELLKEMIAQENADKIGEYSLTDRRFSRITKFMANTLYDENFGGEFGNTHLAVGMSYHDTYDGDVKSVKEEQWDEMGFNFSVVHTDIIATSNRKVTAILKDGSEKVIYEDGEFTV